MAAIEAETLLNNGNQAGANYEHENKQTAASFYKLQWLIFQ